MSHTFQRQPSRPRLAVVCDYAEENWPSMQLVAEMLAIHLREDHAATFDLSTLQPAFRRRLALLPVARRSGGLNFADRLLNRLWDYPRWLKKRAGDFDLFHVADHSYSHLLHVLPAGRAGLFCHDLDTFRCLLQPHLEPRPAWFRRMARHILEGMQKARVVFHSTTDVRDQILRHGLIDPARLVHAPYGIAREFHPDAGNPSDGLPQSIPEISDAIRSGYVLHVGSCIPRKRIDVLLNVFAELHRSRPHLWLVQMGGSWTADQQAQIGRLGIGHRVVQLSGQPRTVIADLYRQSQAVLLPSEGEGFGLPIIEALACGAIVLASDLPVLREVGGSAAVYCPLADVQAWSGQLQALLDHPQSAPSREIRLTQASHFSWSRHATIIADAYAKRFVA